MVYTTKALRYGAQDAVKKCGLRSKYVGVYLRHYVYDRVCVCVIVGYKRKDKEYKIIMDKSDLWDRYRVCELVCAEILRGRHAKVA